MLLKQDVKNSRFNPEALVENLVDKQVLHMTSPTSTVWATLKSSLSSV